VVSTCSYGFTPDLDKMDAELAKKKQTWKDEGKNEKEIEFEAKNWKLLDGLRIVKPDSFDFTLKTIGIYSNSELLDTATSIIIQKLNGLDKLLETDELKIESSKNTMSNCYDVILENEDYTIGKALEYMLYTKFYEGTKVLSFCGFKKMHPHDSDSIIRLAYFEPVVPSVIKQHLKECIVELLKIYQKMQKEFLKLMKN
jgi:DNA-directed RNA polymerase subunit L